MCDFSRAQGATFPIDITKTRLQLQGQADFTGTKMGFGGMMVNIAKTEGVGGLYAGATPAVARHIPYTGFRAIGYEYIRAFFCGSAPKEQAPLLAKMAAGMTAGGIGQAIAVPCDLIKVRMQGDGRLVAAGKLDKPRYTGLFDAFTKIKAAEGMGGFYAGAWPAIQRAALVNLGELTTYDTAKKSIVIYTGDNLLCHLCSAICSGFVASLCSTPADVRPPRSLARRATPCDDPSEGYKCAHPREEVTHPLCCPPLALAGRQVAHHGPGRAPRRHHAVQRHPRLLAQGGRERGPAGPLQGLRPRLAAPRPVAARLLVQLRAAAHPLGPRRLPVGGPLVGVCASSSYRVRQRPLAHPAQNPCLCRAARPTCRAALGVGV